VPLRCCANAYSEIIRIAATLRVMNSTPSHLNRPDRQSVRLRDYDYGHAGAYFITIVSNERA
jgi:hypothetical protein